MRLEAQAKLGFYPVKPETIQFICRSLTVPAPEKTYLLDPCCGKGEAIQSFTQTLGVPTENSYGVELDTGRAESAAERVGNVLNASFFATRIVPIGSFSMVWLNPPYDNEFKQDDFAGKLEAAFFKEAVRFVQDDGIVILHMPTNRMGMDIYYAMHVYLHDVSHVKLPADCSPYGESLLIGRKLKKPIRPYHYSPQELTEMPAWVVPAGEPIRTFQKTAPTDADIDKALLQATWRKVFFEKKKLSTLRPLLPMGAGHLGLTLASGLLDGYFAPDGWEPHVVRGISTKETQLAKTETEISDTGKETTTQTFKENFKLKVRAITADGNISTIQ